MLLRILGLLWLGLLALAGPALAQDAGAPPADPPGIAGRLAWVEGPVSMQPSGVTDWIGAPLNQPLTQGDSLWSDAGARAEIDLGSARVRMDQLSSLSIVALDDRRVQLRLQAGSIEIAVSDVADLDWFEIDAPSATISVLKPGIYRLTVDNAGTTSVAVRSGELQVQGTHPNDPGPDGARIAAGERGLFGANGAYAIVPALPLDEFDGWCQQRQARWVRDQSVARYVSSDAVGYADLGEYGQWQSDPDEGDVWFPSDVAVDWVPYSTGHWIWISRWGWNWVDEAPWGFAPFHYGRWRRFGPRWGWVPCPPHQRPLYAPALVAWIGGPGAPGVPALGGGPAVGWLPLAPGEVFIPAYPASPRYLQRVNLTNTRRLTADQIAGIAAAPASPRPYVNARIPGAIVIVPQVNFTAAQAIGRHRIGAPQQWQAAAPSARAPSIAPERASVTGGLNLTRVSTPPGAITTRPTLARRPPPAPAPPGRDNSTYRSIPERAPQFQKSLPAQADGENVFERRTREIEREQAAQRAEEQPSQAQAPGRPAHAPFQRLPDAPLPAETAPLETRAVPLPHAAPPPPMAAPAESRVAPPPPATAPRGESHPSPPASVPPRTPPQRPDGRRIPESNFGGSAR